MTYKFKRFVQLRKLECYVPVIRHFTMKETFAIIVFFISTLTFGQVSENTIPSKDIYKNIGGLTLLDSLSCQDIVGDFYISNGFCGYNFRLESNMTFQKIDFCCTGRFTVDSGSWTIKDYNTAILKSKGRTLYFDIVRFDNFYFLILPTERHKFINDVKAARLKFIKAKPITIDNITYSVDYMIGYSLIEKYYAKEIEDSTGT